MSSLIMYFYQKRIHTNTIITAAESVYDYVTPMHVYLYHYGIILHQCMFLCTIILLYFANAGIFVALFYCITPVHIYFYHYIPFSSLFGKVKFNLVAMKINLVKVQMNLIKVQMNLVIVPLKFN